MTIEKYNKIRNMYKPGSPCKQESPMKVELESSTHGMEWGDPTYTEVDPEVYTPKSGFEHLTTQAVQLSQRVKDAGGWKAYRAMKKQDRADAKAAAEAGMTVEEWKASQGKTDDAVEEDVKKAVVDKADIPWGPDHPDYGTGELLKV